LLVTAESCRIACYTCAAHLFSLPHTDYIVLLGTIFRTVNVRYISSHGTEMGARRRACRDHASRAETEIWR
jgi:hypothetical protein